MDGPGKREQTNRDGAVSSQATAQRSNDPAAIAAAAVDAAMTQAMTKSPTGSAASATPPTLVPIDPRRQRPATTPRTEAGGPVREATSETARKSSGKSVESSSARTSEQQRVSMPPSKRSKTEDEPLKRLLAQRVLRQKREIVEIEAQIEATRGWVTGADGADERMKGYDAILSRHREETTALHEKLRLAHRARVEERDYTSVPLDTAAYLRLLQLKRRIQDAEARTSEAHKKVLALPFDPENTGRLVVNRQRSLQAENKELARQAVTGRHGQLQCEIALYQRHNADLKAELQRMEAYCERLDAEVAEMQRRIVDLRKRAAGQGVGGPGQLAHGEDTPHSPTAF